MFIGVIIKNIKFLANVIDKLVDDGMFSKNHKL